jgi:hypothetical protein
MNEKLERISSRIIKNDSQKIEKILTRNPWRELSQEDELSLVKELSAAYEMTEATSSNPKLSRMAKKVQARMDESS